MTWQALLATFMDCGGHWDSPVALQALTYFWHGLISAGDALRLMALAHSDDVAAGECMLRRLPGVDI